LFDRAVAAADGVLRHLREQRGVVAHQQRRQGAALVEGGAQVLRLHAIAVTGRLHDGAAHGALAVEQRHADHALVADHGDLGGGAVFHHIQQRNDGGGGEMDVLHRAAEFKQLFAKGQGDEFQMFEQGFEHVTRKRGQEFVLLGAAVADNRPRRNLELF